MGAKQNIFRYIGDEESQNDFFVSLLAWSLEDGPEVINTIQNRLDNTSVDVPSDVRFGHQVLELLRIQPVT
jgi:hypothetical protein